MIDPLPDELKRLFDAERAAPGANAAARAGIKLKLMALVGKTALGVSAKTIVVIVLAIGAAGGGTIALVEHRGAAPAHVAAAPAPHAHAIVAPTIVAAPVETPGPPKASASFARVAVPPRPSAPQPPPPSSAPSLVSVDVTPPPPIERVPDEPALLRDAWSAVSAGSATHALELVRIDEREHPAGVLAEERAAVEVVALAKLDRIDDARAAAAAFVSRYPDSVHRDLIEHALDAADRTTRSGQRGGLP